MMRRFFFTRWKQFFMIMLVPILAMAIIVGVYMYSENTKSSIRKTSNSLELLNENLNGIMSASAYQYDLLTYNPSLVFSLRKLLSEETLSYTDIVFLNTLQSLLSASASAGDNYVDSIYLYLDGYDSFLSSKGGLLSLTTAKDAEWYQHYKKQNIQGIHIEPREFQKYSFDAPVQYLTLYCSMSNTQGVIVINLDIEKLTSALETSRTSDNYILLLDNDGNILCGTHGYKGLFSEQHLQKLIHETDSTKAHRITFDQRNYLSQTLYNSDYGFTLLSLLPTQSIFTDYMSTFLLLLGVVLSNCVISVVLAYVVTQRNFQQISHIINTFNQAEKGILSSTTPKQTINDEYDIILNNVINVFLNSSYLKLQLHEKQYKQELAEMAALQYQINPHFLFNTLQAIDFEALRIQGQSGTINMMIQNLSDILKYSLMDPLTVVTLNTEIDYLKKYVDIQHQRLGDKFIVYYEIDEDLQDLYVLRLMLQPLVENSISHGVATLDSTGFIKVRIYSRNDFIHFTVVDNGIGMSKEETLALKKRIQDENSKNIGLPNINRRLVLKYGAESTLHILSKKGMGTVISFHIPLASMKLK